jgi:hypothetical protein
MAREIVKKTARVPIFVSCAEVERRNLNRWDTLHGELISSYRTCFLKADLQDFFEKFSAENKLIFLFDGLDQIRGGSYSEFVRGTLFKMAFRNPVIVSSRPSAVLALEDRPEITFLRLKPFTPSDQNRYFAGDYPEARRLAGFAPDLMRVPMLAFMAKTLIRAKESGEVSTRTELYAKFLAHVFSHHEPNMPVYREHRGLTKKIDESLKQISYLALNQKEPQIQKIEERLYDAIGSPVAIEELAKFGLVNLIMEKGEHPFILFTHQSFQEFLAAQYVNEHEECLEKVLGEMWNPKWREVIKLLAGLRGREVVERIYSGKDNAIYSRLFLAAGCLAEVKQLKSDTKEKIASKVKELVAIEPFGLDAISALGHLGDVPRLVSLLRDKSSSVREAAVEALPHQLGDRLDDGDIGRIDDRLDDEDGFVRESAGEALAQLGDRLDAVALGRVVDRLGDGDASVRGVAYRTLRTLYDSGREVPGG